MNTPGRRLDAQLAELLRDPELERILKLATRDVMRVWHLSPAAARGTVLSAIGEPATLLALYDAWTQAKQRAQGMSMPKLIVRRRVIDLLRKDARPASHGSLPAGGELSDGDDEDQPAPLPIDHAHDADPDALFDHHRLVQAVRDELACFAAANAVRRRQAELLRRYRLEGASYLELSRDLGCNECALRVRVRKAVIALTKHIRVCRPALSRLLT